MKMDNPAIVVVAYNRPDALGSLLQTLQTAVIPEGTTLVISVEGEAPDTVVRMAQDFDWRHGPKRVINQKEKLGLREHILRSGDLSQEYGSVIVLEDDLILSPHFYTYTASALATYQDKPVIAGVALYNYIVNEFSNLDFEPLNDGGDVYFLQIACSWGQAWTAGQWSLFRTWYAEASKRPFGEGRPIPRLLHAWGAKSWKRFFIKYLVETDRFFVYPRASLTSNTARPGTHTKRPVSIYQTPLDLRPRQWRFTDPDRSIAVYDAFYELRPEALRRAEPQLGDVDFDVDIWCDKPPAARTRPFLLSGRNCRGAKGFGAGGAPVEATVAAGEPGSLVRMSQAAAFSSASFWSRYRLLKAASPAHAKAKLLFSTLKPVQTELKIISAQRKAAKAAR